MEYWAGMSSPATENNRFNLLIHLGSAMKQFPHLGLAEALSAGQVESKRWLIDELEKLDRPLGTVFVLGGWWGLLPAMLFESRLRLDKIRSFDIDAACAPVADTINRRYVMDDWKFKASTQDMLEMRYDLHSYPTRRANGSEVLLEESPDTIINTSCEHISSFSKWWKKIPPGKLVVLQSNDFRLPAEHINCSDSLDKFSASAPMKEILFRGELDLPDYKRFMLVGLK
jgi:hypothetical protein